MKPSIQCLVFTFCFFMFYGLHAQTEKGSWLAGGQLDISTVEKNSRFVLNPNAGYFFLNNVAFGANLNASFEKTGQISSSNVGIGPFARFYLGRGDWRPFLNATANLASQRTKIGQVSSTSNGASWLLGAGVAWFVTDNAALETAIGYTSTKFKDSDATKGMALRLGFQVYFDRYTARKMGIGTGN